MIDLAHEDERQAVVNEVMNLQFPQSQGEILDLLRYYKLLKIYYVSPFLQATKALRESRGITLICS
jgi:hypothetical protein